jgi:hypothetical protein
MTTRLAFPTALHRRVAEEIVAFFDSRLTPSETVRLAETTS